MKNQTKPKFYLPEKITTQTKKLLVLHYSNRRRVQNQEAERKESTGDKNYAVSQRARKLKGFAIFLATRWLTVLRSSLFWWETASREECKHSAGVQGCSRNNSVWGGGRWQRVRGTQSLVLQPLHLGCTFITVGKWTRRGLKTHRRQQEQCLHSWQRLLQTNIHHGKKQQPATSSSSIDVCSRTPGAVLAPFLREWETAAAQMQFLSSQWNGQYPLPAHTFSASCSEVFLLHSKSTKMLWRSAGACAKWDTLGCGAPCTGTDLVNREERGAAVSQASFPALKARSFQRQFM